MANSRKSKSNDLTGRVANALQPVVPAGASIVVGLSGGVDSVVLLHLLAELAPVHSWQLSALHVHHGISPHADHWADFCSRFCKARNIPLQVRHVDIQPVRHMGIEAAARHLRHLALSSQATDFIALAHHRDDQAETVLLQLLRGAGVRGLAAMAPVKPRSGESGQPGHPALVRPALVRPLLDVSRAELVAYAEAHGLAWVEDESNVDESYPRNFLRHRVMPLLAAHFPGSDATLARSASHFAEAGMLLDSLAAQDAQVEHGGMPAYDGETLAAGRLAALDAARAKNLLRWFLHQRGALMPAASRLEEMLRQMASARRDARISIPWGEWELRHYRGRIHVCRRAAEPDGKRVVTWRGEAALPWQGGTLGFQNASGDGVSAEKLAGATVTVRTRQRGERLRPDLVRPVRSLSALFQAHGVPPWLRQDWPLLYCGDSLVAVAGIAVDGEWRAQAGRPGLVLRWDRGAKP